MLKLAQGFDDEYVRYTAELTQDNLDTFEEREGENLQKFQDLKEEYGDLLAAEDPNFSIETLIYFIKNETPDELVARTIENKNPGVMTKDLIESEISRFKWLSHEETPIIVTDEPTDDEYLENLV